MTRRQHRGKGLGGVKTTNKATGNEKVLGGWYDARTEAMKKEDARRAPANAHKRKGEDKNK